ncbi:MAG: DUF1552 domain-containing protein [Rhodobacteraceae bacterium]|nr:DUF1552 domain-containing protein [Paracoccaceae bacterium]
MSFLIPRKTSRRSVLRAMFNGGAVTLALPFLDAMLDGNGTALADTGKPLPVRFGTWYWGMGHTPGHAIKEKAQTAAGIEFLEETKALKPFADQLNFFSGFNMPLDGRSNYTHFTGWVGSRTGAVPQKEGEIAAPTLDLLIADQIGPNTRFRTIDASSVGISRENYSARSTESRAQAEISPVGLYNRLFGPEFVDPNADTFTPDPNIMLEKSVLSAFTEQSRGYIKTLGAADKQRMDQYFTSIRQLENQMALLLQKPEPNEACIRPERPNMEDAERSAQGREMPNVIETHEIMANLMAMAVACNQTRVFNMVFTDNFANVRKKGETYTHHLLTHSELIDPNLGYQPLAFWFNERCSEAFATFLGALAGIKEGAGTLLDNCLVFASSETAYAKLHTVDGIPIYLAGKAGGRMKTGVHVVGGGDPITRVGFTAMKIMDVPIRGWGAKSLQTSKPLTEIMV